MSANKGYVELSDSVIISDLLYFISNKIKTTAIKNVVNICHSFYADNDFVFNEKKKLCDVSGDNLVNRRGDDRRLKNLEDICNIFSLRDVSVGGTQLPKFASVNLNNIPLNDEGEPSLGQLLSTINDLKRNVVTNEQLSVNKYSQAGNGAFIHGSSSRLPFTCGCASLGVIIIGSLSFSSR